MEREGRWIIEEQSASYPPGSRRRAVFDGENVTTLTVTSSGRRENDPIAEHVARIVAEARAAQRRGNPEAERREAMASEASVLTNRIMKVRSRMPEGDNWFHSRLLWWSLLDRNPSAELVRNIALRDPFASWPVRDPDRYEAAQERSANANMLWTIRAVGEIDDPEGITAGEHFTVELAPPGVATGLHCRVTRWRAAEPGAAVRAAETLDVIVTRVEGLNSDYSMEFVPPKGAAVVEDRTILEDGLAVSYWSTTGVVAADTSEVQALAAQTLAFREERSFRPVSIILLLLAAGVPVVIWSLARRRNQ